jgi:hypothetical protein
VLPTGAGLFLSPREEGEHSDAFAAGLGGAGGGCGVEHALEDGGILLAVRASPRPGPADE